MDQLATPSSSRRLSPMTNKKSRNFLKLFFRNSVAERNAQNYILREGSITQNAWNGMSKQSNWKVRLKTLENLEEVVKRRRLQVSTLEGIWAETHDMLQVVTLRRTFLKFMCSLTRAQCEELGTVLRSTFFKTIKSVGFEELSVQWLIALTDDGRNLDSFEYSIGELLVDWLDKSFYDTDHHNDFYYTSALELIELIEKIFIHNSTFIRETHLQQIISRFCKKICNCQQFFIMPLLSCCEAALKYSHIPKSELMPLVVALCLMLSNSAHRQNTWRLMRILLSSVNAYTVLRMSQAILSNFYQAHANDIALDIRVAVVRGAVFCVAMALWGSQRIESLKLSSSIIVPALSEALTLNSAIACEVLLAVRRLVGKFGKSLQQLTWTCVIQLLERAVKYVKINNIPKSNEVYVELLQIILIMENLYIQNEYCGSSDALFQLIESCASSLPDESVFHLIDYRVSCIDPLSGDWIAQLLALIRRHIAANNPMKHREKALCVLGNVYHKYRLLYETEVVRRLSLVICVMIPDERDINFQYQLIMFLFDVAKSVSLRVNNELFTTVIQLIRNVINSDVQRFVRSDNLEIMACCTGELLTERWCVFDGELLTFIINMIIEHLGLQYSSELYEIVGSDVRARLFEAILLIQMEPATQKLARVVYDVANPEQSFRIANPHVVVEPVSQSTDSTVAFSPSSAAAHEFFKYSEFKWTDICKITIKALRIDRSWPVIRKILEGLNGVLEFRCLVYSAGETFVNYLVSSIIELFYRFERGHFILHENNEFRRTFCPVLGKLVNYSQDIQLCKTIIECVKGGCVQAIIICNLAIQVLPEKMAILSRQLIDNLLDLRPCGQLAMAIIELMSDCADAERFYQFFQERQFKNVVDILVPYSNSSRFNIYVVASVYLAFMRWFVRVPDRLRPNISRYIIDSLTFVKSECGSSLNATSSDLLLLTTNTTPTKVGSTLHLESRTKIPDEYSSVSSESSHNPTSASQSTAGSVCCSNDSSSSSTTAPSNVVCAKALFDYGGEQNSSPDAALVGNFANSSAVAVGYLPLQMSPEITPSDAMLTAIHIAMSVTSDSVAEILNFNNRLCSIPLNDAVSNVGEIRRDEIPLAGSYDPIGDNDTTAIFSIGPVTLQQKQERNSGDSEENIVANCISRQDSYLTRKNLEVAQNGDKSTTESYEMTDELMDQLRLFMRFWRKGNIDRQHPRNTTYADFVYFDEADADTDANTVPLHAPWTITEKCTEHWVLENSVISIRIMQRKETADCTLPDSLEYRKATFSGDRPLSTSGINLLANESMNGAHGEHIINATDSMAITPNAAEIEKCGSLARSNSSPPNPLAMFSKVSTNDNINNSTVSTRPFDADGFKMSNQFRRRNFSNTQGMRRNAPSYFSPTKTIQAATCGIVANESTHDANAAVSLTSSIEAQSLNIEYVQIVLRHAFGKESWIMRPFSRIPVDFHTGVGSWLMEDIPSFLLHMTGGINSMVALRVPFKENESIQRSLRILDHMKANELHAVGVLYIGEEQSHESEILANQYGSDRYMKFIRLLGDVISLEEDPGGLQQGKHGEFTFEYHDALSQIVFLVATLMPNSREDPKCNAKKSLIGNNFVSVVFNESGKPYRLGTVSGKFDKITVEVIPHDEDTVVLRLHAGQDITCWMAMTSAYLADADAISVLRRLIVRAQFSVNVSRSIEDCRHNNDARPYLSQSIDRLRKIRSLRLKGVPEI